MTISLQLDESKIEAAIREQVSMAAAKVIGSTPIDPRYVIHTVSDVAKRLGCKPDTIRTYIKIGKKTLSGCELKLRSIDLFAGEYRITEADLREFIDKINAGTTGTGIKHQ